MTLENIIPWGRSMKEYLQMFDLSLDEVKGKRILGVGDGPSSFNTELDLEGGSVVSVDPLYAYGKREIMQRIDAVADEVMAQVRAHQDDFVWSDAIPDPDTLLDVRIEAMMEFLMDYEDGKEEGRYIDAMLPDLPFEDDHFDLALCSHLLFLYSEQMDEAFHLAAIEEMLRVSKEVRLYPLLTLANESSPHLEAVMSHFRDVGYDVEVLPCTYRFQKGAEAFLRISR